MGWQDQNTSLLVVTVVSGYSGVFIYSGTPGSGNLIGSWAAAAGTDPYGNAYPAGLSANQGVLSGFLINSPSVVGGTILNALLSAPTISQAAITGGTITQTEITFNTTGGSLLCYSTTTSQTTYSTPGTYTWTAPAGIIAAQVQCWGSGAGGDGGNGSDGASAGGGGEFAEEPAYPVTPGDQYTVVVGAGGTGGITDQGGNAGARSSFDGQGVVANGGVNAGGGSTGGPGGTGSTNTVHNNGGAGGNGSLTATAGAGGGGSGGSGTAGGAGGNASGSTGAAGGAAGTPNGAAGAAGGNPNSSGATGSAPGGAGGGAGSGGSGTQGISYYPVGTASYYGTDADEGGGTARNFEGSMYQSYASGDEGVTGTQYSYALYDTAQIQSDWSGWTITSVTVDFTNQHSWYDNGMDLQINTVSTTSYPVDHPPSSDTNLQEWIGSAFIAEGGSAAFDISGSGTSWQNGSAAAIRLGPVAGLDYYGYQRGGAGQNAGPFITIWGHKGSAVQAGSGAAGQVVVTTNTATVTLVASVTAAGFTDSFGNTIPAGFMGPMVAVEPGSSPQVPEVWHTPSLTGFNNSIANNPLLKYWASADNEVAVEGVMQASAAYTAGTTIWTMPSGYQPATNPAAVPIIINSTPTVASWLYISTAGLVTCPLNIGNGVGVVVSGRYRLVA